MSSKRIPKRFHGFKIGDRVLVRQYSRATGDKLDIWFEAIIENIDLSRLHNYFGVRYNDGGFSWEMEKDLALLKGEK